jgi:hypothetical protein
MTFTCYIYVLLFVVTNKNLFENNSELHKHKTRLCSNLHLPALSVAKFDKGVYIAGIRVFNQLPDSIKGLVNDERNSYPL